MCGTSSSTLMRLGPIHSSVALALALSSSRQAVRPPICSPAAAVQEQFRRRAPLQLITAAFARQ